MTANSASTQPDLDVDVVDLEKLAAELAECSLHAELYAPRGRLPFLQVRNPRVSALNETVYARSRAYWFSWAEKITSTEHPEVAASTLARVLAAAANNTGE
jgi:hypothetical protein